MDPARRVVGLAGIALAVLITAVQRPSAQATGDQPAPQATAAVQKLLDQTLTLASSGNLKAGLQSADAALALGKQTDDSVGEAYALRLRALHLTELERRDEATLAWEEAQKSWQRVGEGPGQIEAIGWQAILAQMKRPVPGFIPLAPVVRLAQAENRRPVEAVRALVNLESALLRVNFLPLELLDAAGPLAEKYQPGSEVHAAALHNLGRSRTFGAMRRRGQMDEALRLLEQALSIRETLAPDSLAVASTLHEIGSITNNPVEKVVVPRDRALASLTRAMAIRERLAPQSVELAETLGELGRLETLNFASPTRGDDARGFLHRAAEIREKLLEGVSERQEFETVGEFRVGVWWTRDQLKSTLAGNFNELGNAASGQGDLNAARAFYTKALTLSPPATSNSPIPTRSLTQVFVLNSLGSIAQQQGDLRAAADYYAQAAALDRNNPLPFALDSTVEVARRIGDVSAARDRLQQLLTLREKTRYSAGSDWQVQPLNDLGTLALDEGDLKGARAHYDRALAVAEASTTQDRDKLLLPVLLNLTRLDRAQDLASASQHYERAMSIATRLDTSLELSALLELRDVARLENDATRARALEDRIVARLTPRIAAAVPETLSAANALVTLSALLYERKDAERDAALGYAVRAWSITRDQARLVAGDEARQAFESQYQKIGSHLVRIRIARGEIEPAFKTLEEGRAQSLLQFAAERGLARRIAPKAVWQEYQTAQQVSDRAGQAVESAMQTQDRTQQALKAEQEQKSAATVIDQRQRALDDATRRVNDAQQTYTRSRLETEARWATVRQAIEPMMPAPMDLAAARRVLPADTLLAAFSVGEKDAILFLVGRDGPVSAYPLGLTQEQLEARVQYVRRGISREAGQRSLAPTGDDDVRITASRDLFQKLFPEAARLRIAKTPRLLLAPDGALWDLPFAALITNAQGAPTYLGLEHPLTLTPSLTMWARVTQTALAPLPRASVVVVGNPLFDNDLRAEVLAGRPLAARAAAGTRADGELRTLSRDGGIPEPLPFAADEARQVAALYNTRAATGIEPTEQWFRLRAGDADIIHLATHGYFNPFRAASSGIRLAVPEQPPQNGETVNDGALQAWEVMSQLQLHARLVVLSACETGMGTKVPGEGLVGLTRAFLVAGAQSVVATQWKVADASTSSLMVAFHQQLRAGIARDEAMRRAMQTLAANKSTKDPYYWAPFVLVGDSRPLASSGR